MADLKEYYYNKGQQEERKADLLLQGIVAKHHINTNNDVKTALEEAVNEAQALISDYNIYKDTLEMSQYYYKQMPDTTNEEDNN